MNTINTIHQLSQEATRLASYCEDFSVPMSRFYGIETGELADHFAVKGLPGITPGTEPKMPTRSALLQLANLLGTGKTGQGLWDEVRPRFPGVVASVFNLVLSDPHYTHIYNGTKERQLFIRSREQLTTLDGSMEEAQIRAVLTSEYTPLDTADVLSIASQFVNLFETGGGLHELLAKAQDNFGIGTNIKITKTGPNGIGIGHELVRSNVWPDGCSVNVKLGIEITTPEGDRYSPLLWIRTNDIGGGSVHIIAGLLRTSCLNSFKKLVSFKEATEMRKTQGWSPIVPHRWGTREDLALQATKAMAAAFMGGVELVNKARMASYRKIPNANQILVEMIGALVPKENREEALLVAGLGMEGGDSVLSVVNGVTFAAHKTELLPQDTVDSMEIFGGGVLDKFNMEMSDQEITNLFFAIAKTEKISVENEM